VIFNQVSNNFCIGVGAEIMPPVTQVRFKIKVILYDAIMNNDETTGIVGMSIYLRRAAMGCPAGMTNAGLPDQRLVTQIVFQIDQLAFSTGVAIPAES
jgi:hypothetical protein